MSHVLNPFFPRIRRQRIRKGYALFWIFVSVSVLAWGGIVFAGANESAVAEPLRAAISPQFGNSLLQRRM
jgi:hypothetical protein